MEENILWMYTPQITADYNYKPKAVRFFQDQKGIFSLCFLRLQNKRYRVLKKATQCSTDYLN